MIRALADVDGISQSDVVRMLVRRAHAERFGAPVPATAKKRAVRR